MTIAAYKDLAARRRAQDLRSTLDWAYIVSAVSGISPEDRAAIVQAVRNEDQVRVGAIIIQRVRESVLADAQAAADAVFDQDPIPRADINAL